MFVLQKILVTLLVLTALVLANDECSLDTKPIISELEKRYSNEIKGLTFQNTTPCQQIKGSDEYVIYLEYRKPFSDENSDVYSLSLALAVVDKSSLKVKQSFFHKNIAQSDAIYIDEVAFDTSLPKGFLGFQISFYGSSRVNPFSSSSLFIYKIEDKKLKLIFSDNLLSYFHGENNMCNYRNSTHTYKFINKSSFKFKSPLYFQHSYAYEESYCKDESKDATWKVALGKIKWVYKNGVYKQETKEKKLFDLKQIEANVKKGLKYKKVVLRAMLYEEEISRDNLNHWNNIAYYLQKNGQNREAILLLEEITALFPKRVVAYLNLGDAYWGDTQNFEALKNYRKYIELMKKEHKEKKIPKYVLKRVDEFKNFSKNFIEKYTESQTLAPIFLKDMKETKPKEIVPWKQKTVLSIDKEDELLVHVLAYEKDDDVEFVYFVQTLVARGDKSEGTEYAKGKISMYKFSYKERDIVKLTEFDNKIIINDKGIDGTTLDGWTLYNLQEFILDKGYLYFDVERCESKKGSNYIDAFCYKFKYKFGENQVTNANGYMTKNWYDRWNYKHDTFVFSGEGLDMGHNEANKSATKSLFTIKSFKDKVIREETIPFCIGGTSWSEDDEILYFDNHDIALACIWRYDLETKELSKIVPEHEASNPFGFTFKGKEYVVYIEDKKIKVATP